MPAATDVQIEIHASRTSRAPSFGSSSRGCLKDLPPLPRPDYETRSAEACKGITVVLTMTTVLVAFPHIVGAGDVPFDTTPWSGRDGALLCLYATAGIAIGCLCGLLCADPGVVPRCEENSLPIPPSVQARLQAKQPLTGMQNVTASSGRVYCVRCCIWRPASRSDIHHCSTCQRCVRYFDHHCGVFGRCIAGRHKTLLTKGNMRFYYGVWVCLGVGAISSVMAAMLGLG